MRPLANLHAMAGQFEVARELLERSNAILADLGISLHSAVVHDEARVAMLAGEPAVAEDALRSGYDRLAAMGERALLATTAAMLARAVLAQGREDEAWGLVDAAEAAAAADDVNAELLCRSVRAQLLARRGAVADADRVSTEAVELAARTDWIVDQADALLARAEVLRLRGELHVASVTVAHAVDLYERKGNLVSAGRARLMASAAA